MRKQSTFLALAFVTALLMGWTFSRSSLFRLAEVVVGGKPSIEIKKEISRLTVGLLGQNLFGVGLIELKSRIEGIEGVESVSLRRKWPSTLLIEVEEKSPILMIFWKGKLWGLDKSATLVRPLNQAILLPQFIVENEIRLEKIEKILGEERLKNICAEVSLISKGHFTELVFEKIDTFKWEAQRGLHAELVDNGLTIDLGIDDFASAWLRADAAYSHMLSQGRILASLDASYQRRVVGRLQKFTDGLNLNEVVRRAYR